MSDEKDGVVLNAATIVQYDFNGEKEIKFVKPETEDNDEPVENIKEMKRIDRSALKRGFSKVTFVIRNITVEPVMLFFALGLGFLPIVLNQLYFDKVCKTGSDLFGNGTSFPDNICDNIDSGDYEEVENFVQKQVAKITAVSNFLQERYFLYTTNKKREFSDTPPPFCIGLNHSARGLKNLCSRPSVPLKQ